MSSKEVKVNSQILAEQETWWKKRKTIAYLVYTRNITSTIIFDAQKVLWGIVLSVS